MKAPHVCVRLISLAGAAASLGLILAAQQPGPPGKAASASDIEAFEKGVRPLLVQRCYSCHGEAQQFGGLRVDSRERLLRGGERGPAIEAGSPGRSLLLKAIRHEGTLKMPPGTKLSESEIARVEQ